MGLLSVSLAKQNAESVIRGYKAATLCAEPAAHVLEHLELVDVLEVVSAGRVAGGGAGAGAAKFDWLSSCFSCLLTSWLSHIVLNSY
jgi:hypothetical protein